MDRLVGLYLHRDKLVPGLLPRESKLLLEVLYDLLVCVVVAAYLCAARQLTPKVTSPNCLGNKDKFRSPSKLGGLISVLGVRLTSLMGSIGMYSADLALASDRYLVSGWSDRQSLTPDCSSVDVAHPYPAESFTGIALCSLSLFASESLLRVDHTCIAVDIN